MQGKDEEMQGKSEDMQEKGEEMQGKNEAYKENVRGNGKGKLRGKKDTV